MTSAVLQYIALLTMTIDHIGYRLFPGVEGFRIVGRLAFPIFVFMLSEGFVHTKNRRSYLGRLTLFAGISLVPYSVFTHGQYWRMAADNDPFGNIFFELALLFISLWCIDLGRNKNKLFWLGAAACVGASFLLDTMYGPYGLLMGICFYIFRQRRSIALICLAILTLFYCFIHGNVLQMYAALAAVPIFFYNGQRGRRLPRYFSYAFYPAHLLAIYGVYYIINL